MRIAQSLTTQVLSMYILVDPPWKNLLAKHHRRLAKEMFFIFLFQT